MTSYESENSQLFIDEGRLAQLGATLRDLARFLEAQPFVFAVFTEDEVRRASRPQPAQARTRTVKVKVFDRQGRLVGPVESARVEKTDAQWRAQLTPEQFQIARAKGTERPFCGTLLDNKRKGVYSCICCGLPLFASDAKFHSGTGWPSFFAPVAVENVETHEDRTFGMSRVEILCARCDAHLGHVFEDGPRPSGLRYCVNSESLAFTDSNRLADSRRPGRRVGLRGRPAD